MQTEELLDCVPSMRESSECSYGKSRARCLNFKGSQFVLNESGSLIWKMISQELKVREIVERYRQAACVAETVLSTEEAQEQVVAFLRLLASHRLISLGRITTWPE